MPALPNVPKVLRLSFAGQASNGEVVANRVFLQYTGALSTTDLATVVATADAAWVTDIAPVVSNDFTLNTWVATDLTSNTSAQVVLGVSHVGSSAAAPMAAGVAAVIRFKIARRYRGGHPRMYLGPLPSGILSDASTIIAANQTALKNAVANFIAAAVTAPPAAVGVLTHVNVHFFSGFTPRVMPSGRYRNVPNALATPSVDVVTAYTCNPHVGSQRRRNRQST